MKAFPKVRGLLRLFLALALASPAGGLGGCGRGQQAPPRASTPAVIPPDVNRITLEPQVDEEPPAPTPRTLMAMAKLLRGQGKTDEAQLVLGSLLQTHPTHAPAYNELAGLLISQRQFSAALRVLEAGIQKLPGDPVLLNNLGMCHLLLQDYAQAAAALAQASAARPQDSHYRANLALALGMAGREEEAASIYRQILPPSEADHNLELIRKARGGPGKRAMAPAEIPKQGEARP